jgi:cell division protein FtsW (lipid II flippase)
MRKILNPYSTALIAFVTILSIFGVLMSASLSVVYENIILRHAVYVAIGYCFMIFFSFFDHTILRRFAKILFILLTVSLVALLAEGGVTRSLNLGIFSLQPSQFAYIIVSLLIARIFSDNIKDESIFKVFLIVFILVVLVFLLVSFEPDMGSGAQIFLTGFLLLIIIGMPSLQVLVFSVVSLLGVIALIPLSEEWKRRVVAFLNPYAHSSGEALQTLQSLRAFARGGVTGVGFMKGIFKYPYMLPVSISDFILPIIGEEFGAVFVFFVLLIYVGLIYVGFKISIDSDSVFSRILGLGLTLGIASWAILNIAVSLGLMPTTGVPLPFISFGGNNMLANFIAVGILINISRREVE